MRSCSRSYPTSSGGPAWVGPRTAHEESTSMTVGPPSARPEALPARRGRGTPALEPARDLIEGRVRVDHQAGERERVVGLGAERVLDPAGAAVAGLAHGAAHARPGVAVRVGEGAHLVAESLLEQPLAGADLVADARARERVEVGVGHAVAADLDGGVGAELPDLVPAQHVPRDHVVERGLRAAAQHPGRDVERRRQVALAQGRQGGRGEVLEAVVERDHDGPLEQRRIASRARIEVGADGQRLELVRDEEVEVRFERRPVDREVADQRQGVARDRVVEQDRDERHAGASLSSGHARSDPDLRARKAVLAPRGRAGTRRLLALARAGRAGRAHVVRQAAGGPSRLRAGTRAAADGHAPAPLVRRRSLREPRSHGAPRRRLIALGLALALLLALAPAAGAEIVARGPGNTSSYSSDTATQIQLAVPAGAQTGDVLVAALGFGRGGAKS